MSIKQEPEIKIEPRSPSQSVSSGPFSSSPSLSSGPFSSRSVSARSETSSTRDGNRPPSRASPEVDTNDDKQLTRRIAFDYHEQGETPRPSSAQGIRRPQFPTVGLRRTQLPSIRQSLGYIPPLPAELAGHQRMQRHAMDCQQLGRLQGPVRLARGREHLTPRKEGWAPALPVRARSSVDVGYLEKFDGPRWIARG